MFLDFSDHPENIFSWTWLTHGFDAVHIFLQVSSASESEKKEAADLRMALEQQMDQLRIAHQQQVASLRDEIAEKQQLINDIRE